MSDRQQLVTALQLLMADMPPDEMRAIIRAAFGDKIVILKIPTAELRDGLRRVDAILKWINDFADGQSPLASNAQEQIRRQATEAAAVLSRIRTTTR